jgi:pyridoxal/pyridoxine/pyridoxamine kinase
MADIVTPNVKEASKLLGGVSLHTVSDMRDAAASIYKFGPRFVLSILVDLFLRSAVFHILSTVLVTCALSCACTVVHPDVIFKSHPVFNPCL